MRALAAISVAVVLSLAALPLAQHEAAAQSKPASNLDYWLNQASPAYPADAPPATDEQPAKPAAARFGRDDALPGVIELSDGTLRAGGLYTTREKPLTVTVIKGNDIELRSIPLINCLSISAVVEPGSERMEQQWRWKGMGEPEKVYTGQTYPVRQLQWTLRLIDGSTVTGKIKGQPLYIEVDGTRKTHVLHENHKGEIGQAVDELIYIRRVIISRRMMDKVLAVKQR